MKTFIQLNTKKEGNLPKIFSSEDNRFPEPLARHFLNMYTKKGDKVLDLFAGFGTTLIVSEKTGRIPFGVEYDKKRYEFMKSKLKNKKNIVNGNSLKLLKYNFPKLDFCLSSPTYMHKGYGRDPLSNDSKKGTYQKYLQDLGKIFYQLKSIMKKNSYIVIEVSNLKGRTVTTLAWDIAKEISKVFHFEGETIVGWKGKSGKDGTYGYGYDHSYCLVFRNL